MNTKTRRIAVNVGSGFVPGMNAVVKGVTMAAAENSWIRVAPVCWARRRGSIRST
jgi:6-phosphofructokinase